MSSRGPCPDPARVRGLLEDALAPHEAEEVAAHLQQCPRCQRVLEGLAAGQDLWAEAGDLLARRPPDCPEPALQHALARLRQGAAGGEAADVSDLTFLAPSSRPGSLGRLDQYEIPEPLGRGGRG